MISVEDKGISDAIENSVDVTSLADPGYRAGVMKGLCHLRAFLNSPYDHIGLSGPAIRASLEAERKKLNEQVQAIAAVDVAAAEQEVRHQRRGIKLESDGDVPIGWVPPKKMPATLRVIPVREIPTIAINALANCY